MLKTELFISSIFFPRCPFSVISKIVSSAITHPGTQDRDECGSKFHPLLHLQALIKSCHFYLYQIVFLGANKKICSNLSKIFFIKLWISPQNLQEGLQA
jgi:hypothetical protein